MFHLLLSCLVPCLSSVFKHQWLATSLTCGPVYNSSQPCSSLKNSCRKGLSAWFCDETWLLVGYLSMGLLAFRVWTLSLRATVFSVSVLLPCFLDMSGSHRKNSWRRVLTVSGHSIMTMWLPSSMTFRNANRRIYKNKWTHNAYNYFIFHNQCYWLTGGISTRPLYLCHALVFIHGHKLVTHPVDQKDGHSELRMIYLIPLRPVLPTHHGSQDKWRHIEGIPLLQQLLLFGTLTSKPSSEVRKREDTLLEIFKCKVWWLFIVGQVIVLDCGIAMHVYVNVRVHVCWKNKEVLHRSFTKLYGGINMIIII